MTLFEQHLVLAAISGLSALACVILGALLNRKMTRIEVKVNGRIDQLLDQLPKKRKPRTPPLPDDPSDKGV